MPVRTIPGTEVVYYLVAYDEKGTERREPDGTYLSETLLRRLADPAGPATDLLLMSHGWQGDVPAAIDQYDRWGAMMVGLTADLAAARARFPGFNPVLVGLHWPSLPWGNEQIPAAGTGGGLLSADDADTRGGGGIEAELDAYARRIADTPAARAALRTILDEADRATGSPAPSPAALAAYRTLFAESGLPSGDASGRPGAENDAFDPEEIVRQAQAGAPAAAGLLGWQEDLRDAALAPVRVLSFWTMKDRARVFGETGAHDLILRLQRAAPGLRIHAMGHSFGCIVVCAAIAGPPGSAPLPRPVDTLYLVQGALSLWAFAPDIPYARGTAGYFTQVLRRDRVRGPVLTTRSSHDRAVGYFYPLGARVRGQLVLGEDDYPRYGGLGTYGIRGIGNGLDLAMQGPAYHYGFAPGRVYNLEASAVVKTGGGASGAHSDIAHPEIAHAFWSAILAPPGSPGLLDGTEPEAPLGFEDTAPAGASAPADGSWGPAGLSFDLFGAESPDANGWEETSRGGGSAGAAGWQRTARGGGLLDAEPSPALAPAFPEPNAAVQPPGQAATDTLAPARWINAEIEDHAPDEPLVKNDWYSLAFGIDLVQRSAAAASVRFEEAQVFADGVAEVALTVQVDTTDFEVSDATRALRVPRRGKSHTKARFDIRPLHDGPSRLAATIHHQGNFIQRMELTFEVGASQPTTPDVAALGRPLAAVALVRPREIGLSIQPGVGGYQCVVWGSVSAHARLPIQPAELAQAVDEARERLMEVVTHRNAAGDYVFQTGIDIAAPDRDFALKTMARAGARLMQRLFYGPAAGADSRAVGDFLKRVAGDPAQPLKIQVLAEQAPLPWGLLYVGDAAAGAKLDWNGFIGMRHIVEQIPLQNQLIVSDSAIPSDQPSLSVSLNLNTAIDTQLGVPVVAEQRRYWAAARTARPGLRVSERTQSIDVARALADGATDDQVLYFYCHAKTAGLTDRGGPDASSIVLTDAALSLGDLNLDAPIDRVLSGHPLVFVNACESAELSPAFYDGFVPYFMAKGARGVVGTECKTPALFAERWAARFFERFLDGEPLGAAFLALRREFLERHGNPLGLLYALHCDADTEVAPPLRR